MDGLILEGPERIAFRSDLADPALEHPSDAVVEVALAGLCGSDLHPYEGRERVRPGTVPGHEVVGIVRDVGDEAGVAVGDRVLVPFTTCCGCCPACRRGVTARCHDGQLFGYGDPDDLDAPVLHGGQAALLRVPLAATTAARIPDAVSDAAALLLTDNLPTAWEAVQRAAPVAGEPIAIVGLGAVGLCAVVAARACGANPIVAIDPVEARRARAADLGAEATSTPADAPRVIGGEGVGAVVEAAGTDAAQRLAFDLLRPGGVLSIIAVQTTERFAFTPVDAYDRNITVRAGRASVRATLDDLLPQVLTGEVTVPVEQVLSHPDVPLSDGPDTYRRFAARDGGMVKAAFAPRDG